MRFHFYGDIDQLIEGIGLLEEELSFSLDEEGFPVRVVENPGDIRIVFNKEEAQIFYKEKIHFFRALGLFVEAIKSGTGDTISEKPRFDTNGAMFDVSRNAVLTVKSIKSIQKKMAIMGLNMMMLYTEDTYTLENHPYFGYMRGRYSKEEIKECDDHAHALGIELVPCIQTLAHLKQALKWCVYYDIKDTDDILLADSDKTYDFIEEMVAAASSPVRSRKIHIGMDEAHDLGLGKYLDKYGYKERFDIMSRHLEKVVAITDKYGLEPMMWSDMYFRLASKDRSYYDTDAIIPESVIENFPKQVKLVYWDYYHANQKFYEDFISLHKDFGKNPVFAGGMWTWSGLCPNYPVTLATSNPALNACKSLDIKEVFTTLWGDNGAETNAFTGLFGLSLFAEHGYCERLDEKRFRERLKFCTGLDYEAFMAISFIDELPLKSKSEISVSNPSKFLLWQDILLGLFDKTVENCDTKTHFSLAYDKVKTHAQIYPEWNYIFDMYQKLCRVLTIKANIGNRIKSAYDSKDKNTLNELAGKDLVELKKKTQELREAHRKQWLTTNKPFGWEVLDLRYGGLIARIDTAVYRVREFLDGKIETIPELEEERLFFSGPEETNGLPDYYVKHYSQTSSPSPN